MLEPMSPKTVRLAVSKLLDERSMTTADFASRAKLTYNQALAMRRGAMTRIDLETMARVIDALDVDPCDLFTVEESETH